ncbi:MAG TPA: hypothetical protein VFS88_09325 [Micavibrio sp.]|nr:hypothetical protein [Micavibrio sp.]
MGDKPKDIRRHLTLIQGGKKDGAAPQPSSEFNLHGFLTHGETLDLSKLKIPPEYYGKMVNGVQYGDPTKQPVLLYIDEENKPVFDF